MSDKIYAPFPVAWPFPGIQRVFSCDEMRAFADATEAARQEAQPLDESVRERAIDIITQLVACHEDQSCAAITVAHEVLAMLEKSQPREKVDDMAHLIRKLAHALRKAAPAHVLPGQATDYLKRMGLLSNILRGDSAAEAAP